MRSNDPIPGMVALPPEEMPATPVLTLLLGPGTKPRLCLSRGCGAELGAVLPGLLLPQHSAGHRHHPATEPCNAASPVGAAGDTGSELAEGSWHCARVGCGRGSDAASLRHSHSGVLQKGFCSLLFPCTCSRVTLGQTQREGASVPSCR